MKPFVLTGVVAGSFLLTAVPAFTQPAPAGKCSLIDGGVRTVAPPNEQGLRPLATPLPKGIGDTIADVSFSVQKDGTVSDVKILCVTTTGREAGIIVNAVKNWIFARTVPAKEAGPAIVEYRISAAGVIPLNFAPEPGVKKLEG